MVFRWAGMDLANRRVAQDASLIVDLNSANGDPSAQLNVDDDHILPMAAVFHGNITDGKVNQ